MIELVARPGSPGCQCNEDGCQWNDGHDIDGHHDDLGHVEVVHFGEHGVGHPLDQELHLVTVILCAPILSLVLTKTFSSKVLGLWRRILP